MASTGVASGPALAGALLRPGVERPTEPAFIYLDDDLRESDRITRGELTRDASALARHLRATFPQARRVVLCFQPGLPFVTALLGTLAAGLAAVPAHPPRGERGRSRFARIVTDCRPDLILADPVTAGDLARSATPVVVVPGTADAPETAGPAGGEVAIVQYTSGSVHVPRGVQLTPDNLLTNLEALRTSLRLGADDTLLSWLPPQHDLGLIGGVLLPLYLGARAYLMSPASFAEDPTRWLTAVARYRVTASAGPDSAYELCVRQAEQGVPVTGRLDAWRVAINGSEPVRARTIRRFAATFGRLGFSAGAMYPCYGLAEATLYVTGVRPDPVARTRSCATDALGQGHARPPAPGEHAVEVVSCGRPPAGTTVEVVDRLTGRPHPERTVGEILVRGPGVAAAHPAGLHTGDLGFLDDGELYVTGRASDLIVVRGINRYASDVELVAGLAHPALDPGGVAAVADDDTQDHGVTIVAEYRGRPADADAPTFATIRRNILAATAEALDLAPARIVLVARAGLPRTTSGKIRRPETRRALLAGELPVLDDWTGGRIPAGGAGVPGRLAALLAGALGGPVDITDRDRPLRLLGIDSMGAARLAVALRAEFGVTLKVSEILEHVTAADVLARVERAEGRPSPPAGDDPLDADVATLVGILEARSGRGAGRG